MEIKELTKKLSELEDLRRQWGNKRHQLEDILVKGTDRQREKVWMITGKFNEVLKQAGFDPSKPIKEFIQRGILTPSKNGNPSISKKINKTNIKCYFISIKDGYNAQDR